MARKKKYSDNERIASNIYSAIKQRTSNIRWERENFIKWYINETKQCYYCGCGEEEINKFYNSDKSKRKKRGKRLEIERINPNEDYEEKNCKLSCYWCNNAKSDTFTEHEFKSIGLEIGCIIRNRIKSE